MSPGELALRWVVAFSITQAVECPLYVRTFGYKGLVAFGASAITHPIVTFLIPTVWERLYLWAIARWPSWVLGADAYFVGYGVLAETFAIVAEAVYLSCCDSARGRQRAWIASIVANTASGLTGLLCSWLLGWP